MKDSNTDNFHAVDNEINKFDFMSWQAKHRTALRRYNRPLLTTVQSIRRSSTENADGATAHTTWNIANVDISAGYSSPPSTQRFR